MNNVLYFPDSPVNILSETEFFESMKDDEGTWALTKIKYSTFTWNFGKYRKKITHSENCLPELDIQAGFSKFVGFFKRVGSISIHYTFIVAFASIYTNGEPITAKTMNFTPESEDEVIS